MKWLDKLLGKGNGKEIPMLSPQDKDDIEQHIVAIEKEAAAIRAVANAERRTDR